MITILLLIVLISISECIGTSCLKKMYIDPKKYWLFFVAVGAYIFVCILLFVSYRYETMGLINVLWSGVSILVILGAGMIFFNETITNYDKIGIVFILAGMAFILGETDYDHFAIMRR
jgi:multidrug transporter EmrE-like cation transporter